MISEKRIAGPLEVAEGIPIYGKVWMVEEEVSVSSTKSQNGR